MIGFSFDTITVVNQASITDWIQALAAMIAVPGAIAGFVVLFRKDKEKEEMIKQLKDQTEQLAAQTGELNAQVAQLGKIHDALAHGIEVMTKDVELSEMIRRNELRPHFQLIGLQGGTLLSMRSLVLKNHGATALEIKFRWTSGHLYKMGYRAAAEAGVRFEIQFKENPTFEHPMTFELSYSDKDGVRYKQDGVVRSQRKGSISNPVRLDGPDDQQKEQ